jgi:hypothetical protein
MKSNRTPSSALLVMTMVPTGDEGGPSAKNYCRTMTRGHCSGAWPGLSREFSRIAAWLFVML